MQIDSFQIGDLIAEDFLGKTYRAASRDGDVVQIKIFHKSFAGLPDYVETFKDCAAAACELNNEHLLNLYGYGTSDYGNFVVSEATELLPLEKVLSQGAILPALDVTTFIHKVATTVRSIHIEGSLHGALTPGNICTDPDFQQIRITGFGFESLIRLLVRNKTEAIYPVIPYFSPEITTPDVELQRQSDIYSIGVIFYRLLVGHTPWMDDDFSSFYLNGQRPTVVPPSLQRLEIPDLLDEVVLQSLEPSLEKRCQNLSMLIKNIGKAQSDISASVTPISAFIYQPDGPDNNEQATGNSGTNSSSQESTSIDSHFEKAPAPVNPQPEKETGATYSTPEKEDLSGHPEPFSFEASVAAPAETDEPGPNLTQDEKSQGNPSPSEEKSSGNNYKNRLLAHEEDFFVGGQQESLAENKENHEGASMAQSPPEEDLQTEVIGPSEDVRHGPTSHLPDQADNTGDDSTHTDEENKNEAAVDPMNTVEAVDAEIKEAASEPHVTSNQEVESLQANELDDSTMSLVILRAIAARNQSVKTGTQQQVSQGAQSQPDMAGFASAPKPVNHFAENEAYFDDEEDYYEETATHTEDYATTNTVNLSGFPGEAHKVIWLLKVLIGSLIPIAGIYLLLAYAFDLDLDFRNNRIFQRFSKSQVSGPPQNDARIRAAKQRKARNLPLQSQQSTRSASPPNRNQNPTASNGFSEESRNRSGGLQNSRRRSPGQARDNTKMGGFGQSRETGSRKTENARTVDVEVNLAVTFKGQPVQAKIYLDGRFAGVTNTRGEMALYSLRSNQSYLLKVERDGFKMWAREIGYAQNGSKFLSIRLERQTPAATRTNSAQGRQPSFQSPSPKKKTPTQTRRNSQPSPNNALPSPLSDERQEFGVVDITLSNVESVSDAYIYVNDALWNGPNYRAPARVELPAGTYLIEVRKDGYFSAPRTHSVTILNGETKSINFILTAQ